MTGASCKPGCLPNPWNSGGPPPSSVVVEAQSRCVQRAALACIGLASPQPRKRRAESCTRAPAYPRWPSRPQSGETRPSGVATAAPMPHDAKTAVGSDDQHPRISGPVGPPPVRPGIRHSEQNQSHAAREHREKEEPRPPFAADDQGFFPWKARGRHAISMP
jgi:hypothetical protein